MMKSILFLAFTGLLGLQNLAAQKTAGPMVAYRKNLVWHFYDTQNQLMFANPLIAPAMIDGYVEGYARVRAATNFRKDATPIIAPALVDSKGKFLDLNLPQPDSVNWKIIDIFKIGEKERVVQVMNYSNGTISFVNQKNKIVPATSLFYTQNLGEGIVAGFGALPLVVEEEPKYNADFVEINDFEIWSITNGAKISSLKAQQLGQASNGIIPAKKGNKWGFTNIKGKWICEPKFSEIGQATILDGDIITYELNRTMADGLIPAREGEGAWGLIDQNGAWLVKPKYQSLIHITPHCWLGMTMAYEFELLNNGGKPLKVQAPNSLSATLPQINSYETVGLNSPILLLNFKGETGFHIYNSAINKITYSCQDCVLLPLDDNTILMQDVKKQLLIDADGKVLATLQPPTACIYEASWSGLIGFAEMKSQKYGYIHRTGKVVIAPTLDKAVDLVTPDFLYYFDGENHIFLDRTGKIIRKDAVSNDADWDMMAPLQGEEWSFMNN
jgi:hypothetical protein